MKTRGSGAEDAFSEMAVSIRWDFNCRLYFKSRSAARVMFKNISYDKTSHHHQKPLLTQKIMSKTQMITA